jgi:hypothetical protein
LITHPTSLRQSALQEATPLPQFRHGTETTFTHPCLLLFNTSQ